MKSILLALVTIAGPAVAAVAPKSLSPYDVVMPSLNGDPVSTDRVVGQMYQDVSNGTFKVIDNTGGVQQFMMGAGGNFVDITSNQSVGGSKTFTSPMRLGVSPTPSTMALSVFGAQNYYVAAFTAASGSSNDTGVGILSHTNSPAEIVGLKSDYGTHNDLIVRGDTFVSLQPRIENGGPVPNMGACGTGPSLAGSESAGTITVGTGGSATSCAMTFATTWNNPPSCVVNSDTDIVPFKVVTTTTTMTVTASSAFSASSKLHYHCIGF